MAYLGREIWLFLTEEGRPGALYSVSGRSPHSRQREAVYYPKEKRVAIEPLDKSQTVDSLRHYNAMLFNDAYLAVSNGLHTEDMLESCSGKFVLSDIPRRMKRYLDKWGPEPDSLKTPRIGGIIYYAQDSIPPFYLAIIKQDENAKSIMINPMEGIAYGISTYSGKGTEPESFDTSSLFKTPMSPNVKLSGKSVEEVTRFFVDKIIDPEFFVCCSTAIWNEESEEWEVAILNKSR